MLRIKALAVIPLLCMLPACENSGANYTPVIDGSVGPNYSNDLAYCQALASQQGTFSNNTAATAATGAVIAGGTTAVLNNKGTNVRDATLVGAAAGVAAGALQQQQNKEAIIKNCMRGRGYRVVG
ncbi:hypothetical protein [Pseudodonghicola xiamenensis]|uniref:Glycine zipper family protein n=1 Tax=Pseudodonghicola xiamenensis TaxID=337702 RepID=A0A8J3MAN5_9RHOB|nr:hypothetical protein [Pseudodonghicola xiamenensis]GHG78929.1 hypothetical protein GCM10010961_00360 [Pseudodonghicola xiamenensis]